LHEAGIALPFRQADVTLRNADWLREALSGQASAARVGTAAGNGKAAAAARS
jgi:hypothetical protein